MHGHAIEAELLQRGRHQDGEEDVTGRRRQPESENEAGEGAHREQQQRIVAGEPQQIVGEAGDHAGHRKRADQKAAAGEDADQLDECAAVDLEELADRGKRPARILGEELVQYQQQRGGIERRVALALEIQQHHDQQRDDEDVVPAVLDRIHDLRQFGARNALQSVARGIGIHLHEQADIIQHRRNDRGESNVGVADVEELCDHERGRAHHRRRQYRAGRRAGLDRGGIGGAEAALLHHGNGHGAGGQHVGDDRAGHHAEQAAGKDAHLRRAAAEGAA